MSKSTQAKSSLLVSTASGMSSARISGSSAGELGVGLVVAAELAQRAGPVVADAGDGQPVAEPVGHLDRGVLEGQRGLVVAVVAEHQRVVDQRPEVRVESPPWVHAWPSSGWPRRAGPPSRPARPGRSSAWQLTGASASTSSGDSSRTPSRSAASCDERGRALGAAGDAVQLGDVQHQVGAAHGRAVRAEREGAVAPGARVVVLAAQGADLVDHRGASSSWSSTQAGGPVVPGRQRAQLVHRRLDLDVARLDRARYAARSSAVPCRRGSSTRACTRARSSPRQSSPDADGRRHGSSGSGKSRRRWLDSTAGPRRPTTPLTTRREG